MDCRLRASEEEDERENEMEGNTEKVGRRWGRDEFQSVRAMLVGEKERACVYARAVKPLQHRRALSSARAMDVQTAAIREAARARCFASSIQRREIVGG